MEKITITFLGTANAIPTAKRSHTAIFLQYKNENILIDCGEGAQRQFRIAKLSPSKVNKILLTHWHGDHVLGLPGLFQTLNMTDYQKTLKIYGPKRTPQFISELEKLFKTKISTETKEVFGKFIDEKEFFIETKEMSHRVPCLAYSFVIKEKLRLDKKKIAKLKLPNSPLLAKLAQGEDITFKDKKIKAKDVTYKEPQRKITFILDTAPNQNAIEIAKDSDLLICEASFTQAEKERAEEKLHLTAKDASTIAKKAKAKQLILTHISQRYEHNTKPILNEAKKVFKNTKIVKDFDVAEL
ncbi:MAG: ribonuclease Z [archaeon]